MFADKKIITAKQMKTFRAKDSSVMKEFMSKGGGDIIHREVQQRELWKALRNDSKMHEPGKQGYTKKDLTKFLGDLLENKKAHKDHIADRDVKKIADLWGIKRGKLFDAAAQVRRQQNEKKIKETQLPNKPSQSMKSIYDEIISKRKNGISSAKVGNENVRSESKVIHFSVSNKNFREADKLVAHADNKSLQEGHDFRRHGEIPDDIKDTLRRIQQ